MEKGRQSPRMQDGFRDIVPVPPSPAAPYKLKKKYHNQNNPSVPLDLDIFPQSPLHTNEKKERLCTIQISSFQIKISPDLIQTRFCRARSRHPDQVSLTRSRSRYFLFHSKRCQVFLKLEIDLQIQNIDLETRCRFKCLLKFRQCIENRNRVESERRSDQHHYYYQPIQLGYSLSHRIDLDLESRLASRSKILHIERYRAKKNY